MKPVNKYLNQLNLRLVFDDSRPGEIYALNPEKTSIYFIIDVNDNCLYINQSILNIYTEKEIKAFLQEINIQMDIFPQFNDPSDVEGLKPSKQKYFGILMEDVNNIKIDPVEYNNYIFLFNKNNNNILQYNPKNDYFYNKYNSIWSKIQPYDEYKYNDTQRIIKETVEGHFKNKATTPTITPNVMREVVEGHFKIKATTPRLLRINTY